MQRVWTTSEDGVAGGQVMAPAPASTRSSKCLAHLIGDSEVQTTNEERLWMIETNVDDMSPQIFRTCDGASIEMGALDCYSLRSDEEKSPRRFVVGPFDRKEKESLTKMLFAETTTLGVRSYEVERRALEREIVRVETQYGLLMLK